ncbi:MAG: ATP-grasp domain-containing protein [Deltaproteobacteria bacterium]|nr:ATP-grasp domain-containing protein [Deltaproteobacteria bacterium]
MTSPEFAGKKVAVLYTSVEESIAGVADAKMRESMDLAVSARSVADALGRAEIEVRTFAFGRDVVALAGSLRSFGADAVFNLSECPLNSAQKELHGAAFLELLKLPYTGNGPYPLAVCNNKELTKRILASHGIATPAFRLYSEVPRGRTGLPFPVIVKPAREDGSAGITEESVVEDEAGLKKRVAHVVEKYNQEALAEEYVGGREFNVAVLGNGTAGAPFRTFPPAELVYKSRRWRVCSFESKWDPGHPAFSEIAPACPADIGEALRRRLAAITIGCARLFGLCGYSRVDFRANRNGKLFVLEVNPNPDISPDAGLARAARAEGLSYDALILAILRLGLARGVR